MRKHSSRIFIGCHITVILEEQDAYNMRCSAKEEGGRRSRGRCVKESMQTGFLKCLSAGQLLLITLLPVERSRHFPFIFN